MLRDYIVTNIRINLGYPIGRGKITYKKKVNKY